MSLNENDKNLVESEEKAFKDLNEIREQSKNENFQEPEVFNASFFSHRNGKFVELLNPKEGNHPVTFDGKGYVFQLRSPALVTDVTISAPVSLESKKLKVEYCAVWENDSFATANATSSDQATTGSWAVNQYVSKIRISSTAGRFSSKQAVSKITIYGYQDTELRNLGTELRQAQHLRSETRRITEEQLSSFAKSEEVIRLDREKLESEKVLRHKEAEEEKGKFKIDIEALRLEKKKAEELLEQSKKTVQTSENELSLRKSELESENQKLEKLREVQTEKQHSLTQIESQIEQKTSDRNSLSSRLTELQVAVQDWASRKNLFTANLEGVLKEYRQQTAIFFVLSLLVTGILIYISYRLFDGAQAMLASILTSTPPESMWAYLATRLPYALVGSTIVSGLLGWAFPPLIRAIMEIFRGRRRIIAASFLVKEVTDAVCAQEGLSPEETAKILIGQRVERLEKIFLESYGEPNGTNSNEGDEQTGKTATAIVPLKSVKQS